MTLQHPLFKQVTLGIPVHKPVQLTVTAVPAHICIRYEPEFSLPALPCALQTDIPASVADSAGHHIACSAWISCLMLNQNIAGVRFQLMATQIEAGIGAGVVEPGSGTVRVNLPRPWILGAQKQLSRRWLTY